MTIRIKGIEKGKTKEELKNLAVDLIRGINHKDGNECRELAWMFFLKSHNSTSVFKQVNPEEYDKNIKSREKGIKKKLNNNTITKCYGIWTRTNFVIPHEWAKKRKKISQKPLKTFRTYMFNFEPFYYYCKIHMGIKFTNKEKAILELLFLPEPVKKELYKEYHSIDFLEAILKYYTRFYIYFLENPSKKRLNHYFDRDFLDYILNRKYIAPKIPCKNQLNLYDEKGNRLFKVVKSTKENRASNKLLDKYNIKFKQYWSPTPEAIITQIGKGNKKISLGEWTPKRKYYSVYESLHIFYPGMLRVLDHKILSILLRR